MLATQQRLTELGYWLGTPDGHFGALTQQAVFALQKAAGLSRDGSVGPKTAKALADGIRPRATLSGNGSRSCWTASCCSSCAVAR